MRSSQKHVERGTCSFSHRQFSCDASCDKHFTLTLDDANIDQALFGPPRPPSPFYWDFTKIFTPHGGNHWMWDSVYVCCNFCLWQNHGVQSSSTSGESVLLVSCLLTLFDDDGTWEPPGHSWRPQLSVLRVGRVRVVATGNVGPLRGRLGIVLIGMAAVIVVRLVFNLVFFSDVAVCQRSRVVGLVATVRQGLDWGGGNI